jgi:hypothetical protein
MQGRVVILSEAWRGCIRQPQSKDPGNSHPAHTAGTFHPNSQANSTLKPIPKRN